MRPAALLLACALPWQAHAAEPPLRLIAPLNHAMPFGGFEQGRLTTGIVKDISDNLAARLGRAVEYLPVPPRRAASRRCWRPAGPTASATSRGTG
ncbi:hypothetical protein [Roseateles sp.]|uniref:hypothetical protein n=1 Tax=Roseateles sp. TaxID=1971397 RepID=UPI0025DC23E9|nr:hypothetical protein [Roseateles sp.]MBV8036969.1 hypothetical protein [Roseateles sp.]